MARDEFARRRRLLMRQMGRDSIAILPAAPIRHRNSDVEYPYRQDSDFHYLTGFGEPEAVAVLVPGRAQAEYILFVRERNPERETWDGRRAGPAGAKRDFGADDAFPFTDLDEIAAKQCGSRGRQTFDPVGLAQNAADDLCVPDRLVRLGIRASLNEREFCAACAVNEPADMLMADSGNIRWRNGRHQIVAVHEPECPLA